MKNTFVLPKKIMHYPIDTFRFSCDNVYKLHYYFNKLIYKCNDWERDRRILRFREPVVGVNRYGAAILNHP